MEIEDFEVEKVSLDDGDLMFIRLGGAIPNRQLMAFRKSVHEQLVKLGKAESTAVFVVNVDDMEMVVLKNAQLNDIHQRLDDLEKANVPPCDHKIRTNLASYPGRKRECCVVETCLAELENGIPTGFRTANSAEIREMKAKGLKPPYRIRMSNKSGQ